MKNNKHAISLIILVITILVLAIIATAVIISLSKSDIMGEASKTTFKQDMANYKEVYELYVTDRLAANAEFDRSTLNVTYADNPNEFKEIFGDKVPDKYKEKLKVVNGKLVYETTDETEKNVLKELGIASSVEEALIESELPTSVKEMVGTVPIPKGFYHVGGTASDGLVISDNEADVTNGLNGNTAGNQFVWIPVTYTKTEGETADTNGLYPSFVEVFQRGIKKEISSDVYTMTDYEGLAVSYTEPCNFNSVIGYTNEASEYYAMMRSVQKYGGFYIARFEAGDEEATVANSVRDNLTEAQTVISKKGAQVYNFVPWGLDTSTVAPRSGTYKKGGKEYITTDEIAGAVYLSKNMATQCGYTSVVSTLCYGVQWDAIMNFVSDKSHSIVDSSTWGNYKNSSEEVHGKVLKTGSNPAWQAKHIYDLAGNVFEWTMEAFSSANRVRRGGASSASGAIYPASSRLSNKPNETYEVIGFRPALYII